MPNSSTDAPVPTLQYRRSSTECFRIRLGDWGLGTGLSSPPSVRRPVMAAAGQPNSRGGLGRRTVVGPGPSSRVLRQAWLPDPDSDVATK
jgi:hypothetical protein